ncbi:MAG: alpha-L-fucosidase [Massilibacteroides sp.]|nr:alpha-L-fucosidase [Massilibacteroides sp.]MDD4115075.1 alpha-L-fucosidase [Massilibacteroides sp.]MDD4659046.1 alpha-L-fucosidase [Massilibacteroides sp.]
MRTNFHLSILCGLALLTASCMKTVTPPPAPVLPVPSERQLAWHELEQYAFVHFTTNTFTGKEWGFGDEKPTIFNPTEMDTDQWAQAIRDAGLKGIVLTCKHHDGFCLWPSLYTDHSVKNSNWKDGKGNVVKEVRESCKKYGLKFGIYLSPWDRNNADYGTPSYIEYYRNQLRELFNDYGPVFEMWFDGANGGDGFYGGANEKRSIDRSTYYDWPNTIKMVQQMDPNIVFFSDAGPDIRWCGNERGYVGETNWSPLTPDTLYAGKPHINELLNHGSEDGSVWLPAEVDVSIRPGWFYHSKEDSLVKTPEKLFEIYLNSVGRGANLILNIPPDQRGLLHENDVKSLRGWKKLIDEAFATNLVLGCEVTADTYRGESAQFAASNLIDEDKETYWATDDDVVKESIKFDFGETRLVKYIVLQEYIRLGQRVRNFSIDAWMNNSWQQVAQATTIGHKRIVRLDQPIETQKIKINIEDSRACPVISNIEIY